VKYKVGDRVLVDVTFISGVVRGEVQSVTPHFIDEECNIVYIKVDNNGIEDEVTLLDVSKQFTLDVQYYRNERLNKILDR
jgi:hypothetical protein